MEAVTLLSKDHEPVKKPLLAVQTAAQETNEEWLRPLGDGMEKPQDALRGED